ncbi:hypothetical protein BY996DRAFT_6524395 [Phakopsora pachyrhizi]|nr:hypothetical protein BY996DRAFT_6524395 [Phakopsora pachyrhizi]
MTIDELVAELAELGPGFGAGLAAEADLELAAGFAGVELRLAEADPVLADGLEAMEGCGGPERRMGFGTVEASADRVEDWRGQYLQVRCLLEAALWDGLQ